MIDAKKTMESFETTATPLEARELFGANTFKINVAYLCRAKGENV